jgi:hypothetical protein
VGVCRQEVRRRGVAVREVAAPAAGDADLLGDLLRVVDQQHLQAALAGDRGAVQTGRAGTDDDGVDVVGRRQGRHTNGNASCLKNPFGT